MPGRYDDAEYDDDPEAPQERDRDDEDEEADTVPCPHCGRSVYEDADRCPHCGENVMPGRGLRRGQRGWMILAAVFAAALLAAWLLWRCPR